MSTDIELLSPSRNCPICKDPRTPDLELQYAKKFITAKDVISILNAGEQGLGINRTTWYTHIRSHLKPDVAAALSVNAETLANAVVDKVQDLIAHLDMLQSKVDSISATINASSDPGSIKAFTALSAELRHTITDMAKIQGEFTDSTLIQINQYKQENYNITEMVLGEACPMCKQKFLNKLEKGKKVETGIRTDL